MFLHKALQSVATPLSLARSKFELWLNVLDCNENFGRLSLNVLQGKVVMPTEESANFLSTLGHIDRRVELDKKIKPGDKKYFALLSVMASKIAYENEAFIKAVVKDHWEMEVIEVHDFWNEFQQKYSTQGLIIHAKNASPDMIIVAFRGTEPFNADDWCTDVDLSWYKFQSMGKVHSGFMKALGLQKDESWPLKLEDHDSEKPIAYYTIREKLREKFQLHKQTKFIVTGHSLGGALAVLFPAVLAMHNETSILERLEAIYTFGQPRVGDEKFGKFMKEHLESYSIRYYRFVYSHDIVPRLPCDDPALLFKHFGTCLYYNCLYEGEIVQEEPYKNYFSIRALITRRVDALWEIIRSLLLPYIYGPEYKEVLLLKLWRLCGLLIPGLPAHGIYEYINSIRLGAANSFY